VRRFGFAFAPDSQSFITTDREGWLAVYDSRSLQVVEPLPALGSNNWGVALSPDGRLLAAGQASGQINICDWKTRAVITNVTTPFRWFGRLRFSASGRFLVANVIFNDQTQRLRIWRTNDWSEVPLPKAMVEDFYALALSPNDRLLAVGYTNGAVRLWKFPTGELVAPLPKHTARVYDLRFSPEGRVLVSASGDGRVGLWDVAARRPVRDLPELTHAAYGAGFSPDSRRLATGGDDASDGVKLWDLSTQRELLTLAQDRRFFLEVNFSPDGNTLQAISFSGIAHLWRSPSWAEIEAAEKRERPPP
jgi:WD40 repeat protein